MKAIKYDQIRRDIKKVQNRDLVEECNTLRLHKNIPSSKSLNSLFYLLIISLGFNYYLFNSLKRDLQADNEQRIEQLYSNSKTSNRSFNNILIMERINSLNAENRSDLLKIIDRKLKTKFEALQDQKEDIARTKKKLKINFDELGTSNIKRTLHYNTANYHTFRRFHEIKEARLKKRHNEIKDHFVENYDLSNLENKRRFENLEDRLSLDLIAMKEQHRMERIKFREQKFIQMR